MITCELHLGCFKRICLVINCIVKLPIAIWLYFVVKKLTTNWTLCCVRTVTLTMTLSGHQYWGHRGWARSWQCEWNSRYLIYNCCWTPLLCCPRLLWIHCLFCQWCHSHGPFPGCLPSRQTCQVCTCQPSPHIQLESDSSRGTCRHHCSDATQGHL